jgi:hypothetical protein
MDRGWGTGQLLVAATGVCTVCEHQFQRATSAIASGWAEARSVERYTAWR